MTGLGCVTAVPPAAFPSQPDTVAAGDLRGPFDGRVVDDASGAPLGGTSVLASWSVRAGQGLAGPVEAHHALVQTDADGRYAISAFTPRNGVGRRLDRFTLVVYQRGYVGWRSDRRFPDLSPRHDFAQHGNVVRLKRLPAGVSHALHVRFIGPGGPLQPRFAWELPLAAEELRGGKEHAPEGQATETEPTERAVLDPSVLLSVAELKQVTGFHGEFTVSPLPDQPSSPSYGSIHFQAKDEPESYDAALRVYRLPTGEAEQQYERWLDDLPATEETHAVGDRSFSTHEDELLGMGALDRKRGVAVLCTCGEGLCGDGTKVTALLRIVWTHLDRLGGAPDAEAKPATDSKPSSKEPPTKPASSSSSASPTSSPTPTEKP